MNMQNPIPAKVIPEMLPDSHHSLQLPAVNQRSIGKSSLRPIHPHSLPRKRRRMPLRPSMNLIAFRHRSVSTKQKMATALVTTRTTVATVCNSTQSIVLKSVPNLLCFNRLNRKHLIRLHLLHSLGKLHCLFARVEHHPVVQTPRAHLVTSPHCLGHRLTSKQSIEFQVLQPKRICVLVFSVTSIHYKHLSW
jgi:hypothetical protein